VISGEVRRRTNLKEKERKKSGECREQPCLIFSFLKHLAKSHQKAKLKKLNIRKLGDFGNFSIAKSKDNNNNSNNNRHIFTIGFQL
jgi:hypothetical protein